MTQSTVTNKFIILLPNLSIAFIQFNKVLLIFDIYDLYRVINNMNGFDYEYEIL